MAIFILTLHVGKTRIGHRDHKKAFRQLLGGGKSISSLLSGLVENIIFLSGPASDKYDIVQPDHDKEKGAAQGRLPEPEAKQRTKKCQPIQILLCAPRTSVIRMDFLDLTIANAGVTLYLDKDWYSDLYENRDTSIRMVFCFKHG